MEPQQLITVRGDVLDVRSGKVLSGQIVTILGDRIESVSSAIAAPEADATGTEIDLSGHTIVPGLMDMHAHMIGNVDGNGGYAELVTRSAAQEVLTGVRNAHDTIHAGFTAVRDVGSFRAFTDVALKEAIEGGWVEGPRMQVAGPFVTSSSGGGDIPGLAVDVDAVLPRDLRFGVADSVEEVRRVVREILHRGCDLIKVIATGAVLTEGTTPGAPEFTEAEIAAAVEEAAHYGAFVAAHAHGAEGIKRAARAGVRSIEHGSLMDDEAIEIMAERGTYLVADIYCGDYIAETGREEGWPAESLRKNDETTDAQRAGFEKAHAAGVKIAYGTDSGVYPHALVGRQFAYMVRYGMTSAEAIRSATLVAAELMGREDEIGSIEPGKYADLVAVPGDPLADVQLFEDVPFVMKGGAVVKAPSATDHPPAAVRGARTR
jgi:imidazolonepropionase-like amidohydrolase